MKKLFLVIAAVAMVFATSCKKENVNPAVDASGSTFTCIIDNGAVQNIIASDINDGMGKMTTIPDGYNVFWKLNDKIDINSVQYNAYSIEQGSATFTKVLDTWKEPTGPFYAFYPSGIQSVKGNVGAPAGDQTGEFGNTIVVDNTNNAAHLPMFAYCDNETLTFRNICAVLELQLPSTIGFKQIIMKADEKLCGKFTVNGYNTTSPYAVLTDASTGVNTLTLNPKSGQTFAAGTKVYVAVPKGTYSNVSFEMTGTDDVIYVSNNTLSSMPVTDANKIYPANITVKVRDYTIRTDEFCFTAPNGSANVKFPNSDKLEYLTLTGNTTPKTNSGWLPYVANTEVDLQNADDKVYFRATSGGNTSLSNCTFSSTGTGNLTVSGKINYLLDASNNSSIVNYSSAMKKLFYNLTQLTDASGLIMPNSGTSQLKTSYYESMFEGCTGLTNAGFNLPSTMIGAYSYKNMFKGCTALTSMPTFGDVTYINAQAYYAMFENCTTLTKTTTITINGNAVSGGAFQDMFKGCTNLTEVNVNLCTGKTSTADNMFSGWLPDHTNGTYTLKVIGTSSKSADFDNSGYSSSTNKYNVGWCMKQTTATPTIWSIVDENNATLE